MYIYQDPWGVLTSNSAMCVCQALVPVRENSVMLRYIPDPTERFLDGDFQPAPGTKGLKRSLRAISLTKRWFRWLIITNLTSRQRHVVMAFTQ